MLLWKRDMLISIVVLLFSIVNYIYVGTMRTTVIESELAEPGNYVRLWLVLFSILAIALLIRSLRNKSSDTVVPIWHSAAIITVIASVVYLFLLPYLGFIIMTVIFLTVLGFVYTYYMKTKVLKGKTRIKEISKWLIFSIIVTWILYYVFAEVLNVVLPSVTIF